MMNDSTMMGYMGSTRPIVDEIQVRELLKQYYGLKCTELTQIESAGDRNFKVTCSKENTDVPACLTYILKIVNSHESINALHHRICCIQDYLIENGFNLPRTISTIDEKPFVKLEFQTNSGYQEDCIVKLLSYLNGVPLRTLGVSSTTQFQLGCLLAMFHKSLLELPSDNLTIDPNNPWALENPIIVLNYITPSLPKDIIQIATKISQTLHTVLHESLDRNNLTKGIIHGDFGDMNLIVDPEQQTDDIKQKYGIIDFNDFCYSFIILEVGRLIADQMTAFVGDMIKREPDIFITNNKLSKNFDAETLMNIAIQILKGYLSVMTLTQTDWAALYWCIAGSLTQYHVLCEYNKLHQPDNLFASQSARECYILIPIWDQINPDDFLKLLKRNLKIEI